MLVEEMRRLPIGARVRCTRCEDEGCLLEGIVARDSSGNIYVLWDDGSRTVSFGVGMENDEDIASNLSYSADCDLNTNWRRRRS